jgi:hypothetical protein
MVKIRQELKSVPVKIEPVQRPEGLQSLERDLIQRIVTQVQRLQYVGHRAETHTQKHSDYTLHFFI